MNCTWTSFYQEFADKLAAFKDDRPSLIEKVGGMYEAIGMKLPKLDADGVPVDIDPYTVFGLFNKGISDSNRRKIVAALAERFGVEAPLPDDYDGAPILNNLNATFYAFVDDPRRGEGDIDNLWRVFEAQIALSAHDSSESRRAFELAYDAAVGQFGLGWKLTMGLFWARPFDFVSLDSRNRWFLGDAAHAGVALAKRFPSKRAEIPSGKEYLELCDALRRRLGSEECPFGDFPSVSAAAFAESERVNRENKAAEARAEENALGDAGVRTVHYWLYAPGEGACMWDEFCDRGMMGLGWGELGDLSDYSSKEDVRMKLQEACGGSSSQKNSAHAVWQFVHEIAPGDVVFAKRGRNEIIGRGVVEGGYEFLSDDGRYPNERKVKWSHKGSWESDTTLALKTLTDVTDYPELISHIEGLFGMDDGELAESVIAEYPSYTAEDFLSEAYMDEGRYDTLVNVLKAKKNVILQGAPGVGKTFVAKRLAYSMMGVKDPDRVMMVQFHQSYSYEDFIEGYRPCADGFALEKGAFYSFCKKAQDDSDNDYFFIIDEVNRGNLSKIFGELFMLIENDKRGSKNKLQLLYSKELFYVPSNVYIIGMMNTADRSLALLDYALRRRFAFFKLTPGFDSEGFEAYRKGLGSSSFDALVACADRLNAVIAEDDALGEGFCVGHSYFCGLDHESATRERLSSIVEYELVPLLEEYWFDEPSKIREWSGELRRAVK